MGDTEMFTIVAPRLVNGSEKRKVVKSVKLPPPADLVPGTRLYKLGWRWRRNTRVPPSPPRKTQLRTANVSADDAADKQQRDFSFVENTILELKQALEDVQAARKRSTYGPHI